MKSRKNKVLACIIAPIVIFILLYLMFAFITAVFDFREWGEFLRAIIIIFWLTFSIPTMEKNYTLIKKNTFVFYLEKLRKIEML